MLCGQFSNISLTGQIIITPFQAGWAFPKVILGDWELGICLHFPVLNTLPIVAPIGSFTGSKANCLLWNGFCWVADIPVKQPMQSSYPWVPLIAWNQSPCKESSSIPKALWWIQIWTDPDKFHNKFCLNKKKSRGIIWISLYQNSFELLSDKDFLAELITLWDCQAGNIAAAFTLASSGTPGRTKPDTSGHLAGTAELPLLQGLCLLHLVLNTLIPSEPREFLSLGDRSHIALHSHPFLQALWPAMLDLVLHSEQTHPSPVSQADWRSPSFPQAFQANTALH